VSEEASEDMKNSSLYIRMSQGKCQWTYAIDGIIDTTQDQCTRPLILADAKIYHAGTLQYKCEDISTRGSRGSGAKGVQNGNQDTCSPHLDITMCLGIAIYVRPDSDDRA
jgi:hypothetical protein